MRIYFRREYIFALLLAGVFWCIESKADTANFSYTGSQQTWDVPLGVTSITIDATGARGGNSGGLGATATGTYSVSPGETLYIYVGGQGGSGTGGGGWNGGGAGGVGSYGGGGASDVRQNGTALGDRIIVGGGGGGKGGTGSAGGAGGAANGSDGGGGSYAGKGGTTSAGGAGGTGYFSSGGAGSLGTGGAGSNGGGSTDSGGGGGGGYYGGGGGGDEYGSAGGGGGGSSNYLSGTSGSYTAGTGTGNGTVVFTYTVVADSVDPVWYSNGSYTAGAQSTQDATKTTMDIVLQPAGDNCDQAGGDGGLACRTDDNAVTAVRIYYAAESSSPVDGSCSNDVDRGTASYQDFTSAALTTTSETVTGLSNDTRYCFEAAIIDGFENASSAGTTEVAGKTLTPLTPFAYTGAQQSWVVPAGVTSVYIEATGARGGNGGGTGAKAEGLYSVTPGETLYIYVGGQGGTSGGFNGGGGIGNGYTGDGYGGGGASDVRQGGTALVDRIIVGGGGGGRSGGGAAGGNAGAPNGSNGNTNGGSATGGGGATNGAVGAAGFGYLNNGVAGSLGNGGSGGGDDFLDYGGGGGGGGYNGGGGGGDEYTGGGAGGGGSSNYLAGTKASYTAGAGTGNGQVIISYPTAGAPASGPKKGAVMIVE